MVLKAYLTVYGLAYDAMPREARQILLSDIHHVTTFLTSQEAKPDYPYTGDINNEPRTDSVLQLEDS